MLFKYEKSLENGEAEYSLEFNITWQGYVAICLVLVAVYSDKIISFIGGM